MIFLGADYFKPQYFNAAYLHGMHGAPEEPKRSGYWRLLLSQLQAESLKQDEEKKRDDELPEKKVVFKVVENFEPVVRPEAPTPEPEPVRAEERPPVHERPIYRAAETVTESPRFVLNLAIISQEFRDWTLRLEPLYAQMLAAKAANDEEEENIELLLLAA